MPRNPWKETSHKSHELQLLASPLRIFRRELQENPVQIYLGKIQHHPTSRVLLLPPPGWLLVCCVRQRRHCRRFHDQPDFDARLELDGPGGMNVRGGPGLGGPPGLDARPGFPHSHVHHELRGFDTQNGLLDLHGAPEVRDRCRWPFV